jgi:hypothetical protein
VAFVQEALIANPVTPEDGTLVWSPSNGWDTGTAVFVRRGISFHQEDIQSQGSSIAAVSVLGDGVSMLLASIHVLPQNYAKHVKQLTDALTVTITGGRRFVVGGDWNVARQQDAVYHTKRFTRLFERLAELQMIDCHWTQHGKEVATLFRKQDKNAYQCDHFFSDPVTAPGTDCAVLPHIEHMSDHSPLSLVVSASMSVLQPS